MTPNPFGLCYHNLWDRYHKEPVFMVLCKITHELKHIRVVNKTNPIVREARKVDRKLLKRSYRGKQK